MHIFCIYLLKDANYLKSIFGNSKLDGLGELSWVVKKRGYCFKMSLKIVEISKSRGQKTLRVPR